MEQFLDKLEQATPEKRLIYHAAAYADRETNENIEDVYERLHKGVEEHKAAQEAVPEGEHVSWVAVLKPQFSLFYEYNARKGTAPRASLEESLKAYEGEALKTQIDVLLAKAKEDAKRKPEDQDTASTPPESKNKKKKAARK